MDDTKSQQIVNFNKKMEEAKQLKLDADIAASKLKIQKNEAELIAEKAKLTPEEQKRIVDEQEAAKQKELQDNAIKAGMQKGVDIAGNAQQTISGTVSPIKQWIANQPTPGGVGGLLAILIFFLFVIIPVDSTGRTRLQLLWATFTGRTHLSYEGVNVPALESRGASGTFGGNPLPTDAPPIDTTVEMPSPNGSMAIPINLSDLMPDLFAGGE